MPDREGPDKGDDVCLAPLGALTQLSVLRLSMMHGSAAASLPPLPALKVRSVARSNALGQEIPYPYRTYALRDTRAPSMVKH